MTAAARPIVVGYPRSGFTLLISVIGQIRNTLGLKAPAPGGRLLNAFCETAGRQIANRIEAVFVRRGLGDAMIYNENFREMAGGPKWLAPDGETARFRKYIGVKGAGDFTLITFHPRQVLGYHDIVHSHVDPCSWAAHPDYGQRPLFTSLRNPAGTITSACFSLNALASEYIQRYVPPQDDNDLIRQRLALYKLSDLNFFAALAKPFIAYLDAAEPCEGRFTAMRWEDLIQAPTRTIRALGKALGEDVSETLAGEIWGRIDHVNLTGAHLHNYRYGHGKVGGWREWITNRHLDILRDYGFERHARRFGYAEWGRLAESDYTPFQQQLDGLVARGEVFRDYGDEDLFGFAFNKSNLDLDHFAFKRYGARRHTQIERSTCTDNALVMEVSDVAEETCAHINAALSLMPQDGAGDAQTVDEIIQALAPVFADAQALAACRQALLSAVRSVGPEAAPSATPYLLKSIGVTNIVSYAGLYYAVPQSLGPLDFSRDAVGERPGVTTSRSLDDLLNTLGEA